MEKNLRELAEQSLVQFWCPTEDQKNMPIRDMYRSIMLFFLRQAASLARAEQIERDAGIAENLIIPIPLAGVDRVVNARRKIAASLRAQLKEQRE